MFAVEPSVQMAHAERPSRYFGRDALNVYCSVNHIGCKLKGEPILVFNCLDRSPRAPSAPRFPWFSFSCEQAFDLDVKCHASRREGRDSVWALPSRIFMIDTRTGS